MKQTYLLVKSGDIGFPTNIIYSLGKLNQILLLVKKTIYQRPHLTHLKMKCLKIREKAKLFSY